MFEALYDKWGSKVVTGEETVKMPPMLVFYNTVEALEMLNRHIKNKSRIVVHCDVDMDGIGCGYIVKRFLSQLTSEMQSYVINKEKEHGVKERHIDFFNQNKPDLAIIVDSSSNELEVFKQFNCDILVIDHHEISHSELSGKTNDGEHSFIIVNNMIDNLDIGGINEWLRIKNPSTSITIQPYIADSRMSCGLVVYELLRVYSEAYMTGPILENTMLYQWVGVTLFTDAIQLTPDRNQWYIMNTVHSMDTEPTLKTLIHSLNRYNITLSKSNINYSLAPTINKAIRAGASGEALKTVLNQPSNISELAEYKVAQEHAIEIGTQGIVEMGSYVTKDITNLGILPSYCGVIASKLCDEHGKNTVVYRVIDGVAQGSFRGRLKDTDYRKIFDEYSPTSSGEGHKQAFGFKASVEELPDIMNKLTTVEQGYNTQSYLTAGNIHDSLKGKYHIDDIEAFKKAGGIMLLSVGNSKVSSEEQIMISVPSSLASLVEKNGKLFYYNVLGLKCKAFKEIEPGMVNIYAEYSNTIDLFIK